MPTDGFGSDAGRRSLTELGDVRARASRREACKVCGAYFAPGALYCPNCGVRLRLGFGVVRRRVAPPAVEAPSASNDPSVEAGSTSASGARAARPGASLVEVERPRKADLAPERGRAWGERFVAWSAIGIMVALTLTFVENIGGLGDDAWRAVAPTPMVRRPAIARAPAGVSLAPARESVGDGSGDADDASQATTPRHPAHMLPRPAPRPIRAVRKPESIPLPRVPADLLAAAESPAVAASASVPRSRWEAMRDDIAQCATRGFFDAVVCEQRVRVRYCDGWWGRAAECPSGRVADYGN